MYYSLRAIFPAGSSIEGVFETLELAQKAAYDHTPKECLYTEGILWTPHYVAPGDPIYVWTGHMKAFRTCETCHEIIQWNIAPCTLNTYWG